MSVLGRFAVRWLAAVRAILDHTGLCESVYLRPNLPGAQPALAARHERFSSVLVHDIVPVEPDVLVKDVAVVVVERDRPLRWLLLLQRRLGIGTVSQPEALLVWLVVLEVDRS